MNTFLLPNRKLEQIIFDARLKTINSQLRVNVADLVVQALQEQGFSLASSAYTDYDLRLGYGARLTNIEGNEVVVQVSPTGSGIGENELQIRSLDSEVKTEHELQRRWQEVSQSLAGYGMEVGRFERLKVPQQSLRSGRQIRERGEKLQTVEKEQYNKWELSGSSKHFGRTPRGVSIFFMGKASMMSSSPTIPANKILRLLCTLSFDRQDMIELHLSVPTNRCISWMISPISR